MTRPWVFLIPAYNPAPALEGLVQTLSTLGALGVVVIDDGSAASKQEIFSRISLLPQVTVLQHAVNLGKGTALKNGLNFAYGKFPQALGVVTVDADGQHLPEDAARVGARLEAEPQALVIGVRRFGQGVPFRSWLGNTLTRVMYRALMGNALSDTQSGLRGIPRNFIPTLLKIDASGYDYELDMLVACKHSGRRLLEEQIATVYLDKNITSHFNPLWDSMKIYFVLFRFMLTSLVTAGIDYSVFWLAYTSGNGLLTSQVVARFIAMFFNYSAVRKLVFFSEQRHRETFPKYAALVACFGCLSFFLIKALNGVFNIHVVWAKMISELMMFYANFHIQRDFIFTKKKRD
jgi:glycosyltransferase involved in cell wall biosynthesis